MWAERGGTWREDSLMKGEYEKLLNEAKKRKINGAFGDKS